MNRTLGTRLATLLAVPTLALGLAACGSDSDSDSESSKAGSDTSATPSAAASSKAPDAAGDKAIGEAALLALDDFPAGWESSPADPEDDEDVANDKAVATCAGIDYDEFYGVNTAEVTSPNFMNAQGEEVSARVALQASEQVTLKQYEVATSETFRRCTAEQVVKVVEQSVKEEDPSATVGEITLNPLSIGKVGDDSFAFRLTVPLSSGGQSVDVGGDIAFVRVGRAVATVDVFRVGEATVSDEEFAGFVDKAGQKLSAALTAG